MTTRIFTNSSKVKVVSVSMIMEFEARENWRGTVVEKNTDIGEEGNGGGWKENVMFGVGLIAAAAVLLGVGWISSKLDPPKKIGEMYVTFGGRDDDD